MTFRLKQITIQDFRSIRGRATVELDAPIVLIHGANGVGKTSLLSAIELGLTGDVAALSRGAGGFLQHLPHKDAPNGIGRVSLTARGASGDARAELRLTKKGIEGKGLLADAESTFFSDRCYLAQATLSRLLEIYQHQDTRRSDTPLTRFVKDLLRLDPLEALIDGLHPVGHVSRLRAPAPQYWATRAELPGLKKEAEAAEAEATKQSSQLNTLETLVRDMAGDAWPDDQPIEPELLEAELAARRQVVDRDLTALARQRREIEVIRSQVATYAATDAGAARVTAEQALATARAQWSVWITGDGHRLEAVIEAMRSTFAEVPPVSNGAQPAHKAALALVKTEIGRLELIISDDTTIEVSLAEVAASIAMGKARLDLIDQELAGLSATNQELANALAALAPHIHNDDCPVCGRDYREVSKQPLAAGLSARITELSATARRLEALSRERSTGSAALATASRRADELQTRRLAPEALAVVKRNLAQQREWHNELDVLTETANAGATFQALLAAANLGLAKLASQDSALSGCRQQLMEQVATLQLTPPDADESSAAIIDRLMAELDRRTREASERLERLIQAGNLVRQLESLRIVIASACTIAESRRQRADTLTKAKKEADRRIEVAKQLAAEALSLRTEIIRQVFNHDLNAVWRDLFIRLAPDEAFVPRFTLTDTGSGPVEAVLETFYRTGGQGGDPRVMLSAGNLNTAALTLFLALHLSVTPVLPLLIIDDPVQSMDEVHISQFAALLRTLKALDRQVMIAVHERALFDYLTLELSPSFNGDRLITVELNRNPGDDTSATWDLKTFKVDTAIAA